jgi:hypothetical protein
MLFSGCPKFPLAELDPAIHVFFYEASAHKDVAHRVKPGGREKRLHLIAAR